MKKLLTLFLFLFALSSYGQTAQQDSTIATVKGVQCKSMTKQGKQCRKVTRDASGYCFMHKPKQEGVKHD